MKFLYMALGVKLLPLAGINLDVANAYLQPNQARYIKNLYYQLTDTAQSGNPEGSEAGKMKTIQSNAVYAPFTLPTGDNVVIGTFPSRETKELYCFVYNSLSNHFIFRINGSTQTIDVAKSNPCFNFQLSSEFFIGEGQCYLDVNTFIDADSGLELVKKDLYWTDGHGYQGYIRFDDYLSTNGFDATLYPYFSGTYDKCSLVRVGLPTPSDCITYTEVAHTDADNGLNNELLFHGTQIRITPIDVFGRPSEHGIISDLYIPGINDCLSSSSNLPRSLDLSIYVGNPLWDKVQIEYATDNSAQWYIDTTLSLYTGSAMNQWWLRSRNAAIAYDAVTSRITYRFSRDKECQVIAITETTKLQPALARRSQAVGKVGQNLGFANNKFGFNPFSQSLLGKISLTVIPPTETNAKLRQITIYVPIWNNPIGKYTQVDKDGTKGFTWGGAFGRLYSQYFKNTAQSGFTGYLVGGGSVISTQVYVDALGNLMDDLLFTGSSLSPTGLTLQKFVFNNVAQGRYIFRLASHLSDMGTDTGYRETSTTVWGVVPFSATGFIINTGQRTGTQELLIDVCNGDYNTLTQSEILVLASVAKIGNKVTTGYAYETAANGYNQYPIEAAEVFSNHNQITAITTDHNGFYYYGTIGSGRTFAINVMNNNSVRSLSTAQNTSEGTNFHNFIADQVLADYSTFPCNHVVVTGKVLLTGTNIGVSNLTVTLTRGRSAVTDSNGNFSIIAHDEILASFRNDSLVISTSACGYTAVGGTCIALVNVTINRSMTSLARSQDAGTTLLQYTIERGLVSGGSYSVGFSGYDWLGRTTFTQVVSNFSTPSITKSKTIGASMLIISIPPSATFPPETAYIVPSITEELTMDGYLSWIIDSVQFVDSAGAVVTDTTTATQIKLYTASILEYAKQHNYNTTTAWQFITTGTNSAEIADKVQFFINGDGVYFTKTIIALVKYSLDGQYILIDYNSDLVGLKANALVRLIRPKVCTGNEPFYEVCNPIQIVNGKASVSSFTLNAFDTYYLSRQIPVPVAQPLVAPATVITYINQLRVPAFRFESSAPSNFWGKGISNRGRVNVKNISEAELLFPNQIQLSGALSVTGNTSYFQNFDEGFKNNFILSNTGGIVYFRVKSSIVAFITQFSNFTVGFNDSLIRVVNGVVSAPNSNSQWGNPERRTNGDHGCLLEDKSTIVEKEGLIHFLDSSRAAFLQHNFSVCENVSQYRISSWLLKKVKYVQDYNRLHPTAKIYFTGTINPANAEYLLTNFQLGLGSYVNQLRATDVTANETFAFDIFGKTWKSFYSETPEAWGYLESEKNGLQLFSFMGGVPYYHYTSNQAGSFGTIFGQTVERIFEVVVADAMNKVMPIGVQVHCKESGYFADRILTESGQSSRILKEQFKQGNFMYFAPFLRNVNTLPDSNLPMQVANPIFEGDYLYGEWIKVRMVGYPEKNTTYSELSGIIIFINENANTGAK